MVPNPIHAAYELLGEANDTGSIDTFSIYSDPNDILDRFPIENRQKYFGGLTKRSQVTFVGVERIGEMDVSGTQARKLLQHGMKDAFVQLLPEGVDREAIWRYLLMRSFVGDGKE